MNVKAAYKALIEPGKAAEDIPHASVTSTRLWVLVALAGLVLWTTKGILTEGNIRMLFWAAAVYMVSNTATRIIQIFVNGQIHREKVRLAWSDGTLTPEELDLLRAQTAKKPETAVQVPTP